MKTWGVVCTLLSGALFAVLLGSMNTCGRNYEIDGQGRLVQRIAGSSTPPKDELKVVEWDEELRAYGYLRPHLLPGDRLELRETTAGFWEVRLHMTTLGVIRDHQEILTERQGRAWFWSGMVGLSLIPLVFWGIAALWITAVAVKRPRPPPD